ncbi:MAG: cupin domain-containing protein, partial [Dehalococcoidia bacterium]
MFPGVVRRTLVSGDNLTLVEVRLSADSEVPEHTHPHEQAGHVASGRVNFRIGETEHALGPGDPYLIPGDLPHYVRAFEATTLIEVFSPVREEFAND